MLAERHRRGRHPGSKPGAKPGATHGERALGASFWKRTLDPMRGTFARSNHGMRLAATEPSVRRAIAEARRRGRRAA